MKEVTVQIPKEKLAFFLELIEDMGFSHDLNMEIPEVHQQLVLERMKNSNPKNNVPLDTFFDTLDEKLKQRTF